MTEQSLAVREAAAIVQRGAFDNPTKELIRKTVSDPRSPLTQDEFDLFVAVCQHTGLNPLLREIYCARIDGKFTILTGIDGHRKIAQQSRRFRGMAGPLYCGPDGQWTDVWLAPEPPVACKVGVYQPGVAEPTWGIAYFKNYKNRRTPTWTSMPEHMLAVRAEAFALRKCFSRELGGVALTEDGDERPAYVDADGVIDEGHPTRALAEPGQRSARAQSVIDEMDSAIAEGEARALEDEATPFEQEQAPPVEPVAEATKLACAAFVDEVKAANPKLRIALPPEADGEAAWQRWLTDKRGAWATSEHNPNRSQP